jgi:hypothetical protein
MGFQKPTAPLVWVIGVLGGLGVTVCRAVAVGVEIPSERCDR